MMCQHLVTFTSELAQDVFLRPYTPHDSRCSFAGHFTYRSCSCSRALTLQKKGSLRERIRLRKEPQRPDNVCFLGKLTVFHFGSKALIHLVPVRVLSLESRYADCIAPQVTHTQVSEVLPIKPILDAELSMQKPQADI
jgi:hypothetical protein